jgi:redox-sensitive bicupin YhaK (pirin superfamily)
MLTVIERRAVMSSATEPSENQAPRSTSQATSQARSIEGLYKAPGLHWVGDGFRVAGYFSHIPDAFQKLSPFLLLDYHPQYDYAPSERARGVGVHPHRGFETVTIAWQGSVAHKDSSGGGGVIGPGDVQWMTAGAGILHEEFHEQSYARRGGPFQMAQLWVNLPKSHKRTPPRYQALLNEQMGEVSLPNGAGSVRVIAGEHRGVRGPAQTVTPFVLFPKKKRNMPCRESWRRRS